MSSSTSHQPSGAPTPLDKDTLGSSDQSQPPQPRNAAEFAQFVQDNPTLAWQIVTNQTEEKTRAEQLARDSHVYTEALKDESQEQERRIAELQAQLQAQTIEAEELRATDTLRTAPGTPVTTQRSQKIKDPEFFEGDRNKYEDWKLSTYLKLAGNSDHFQDEQQKLAYVVSLLRGDARSQMRSFVDIATGRIQLHDIPNLFRELDRAFGDPDRQGTAQAKLKGLRQTNKSFAAYYAEFSRLAVDTGYNDIAKKSELLVGLSQELQSLLINHDYESLNFLDFVDLCQRLDIRQRIVGNRQNNNRLRNVPATRSVSAPVTSMPTRATTVTETPLANPLADTTTPMDLSAGRPRGRLTEEEKQRRRAAGLCLYCAEAGHLARNCPSRPQAPRPIVGRTVGFGEVPTPQAYTPPAPNNGSENA